uniref:Putative secreted protein n=1 Tax=Anopheles marajoara TaxID=58244 RepID=A0A2M4C8X5_9DIPT
MFALAVASAAHDAPNVAVAAAVAAGGDAAAVVVVDGSGCCDVGDDQWWKDHLHRNRSVSRSGSDHPNPPHGALRFVHLPAQDGWQAWNSAFHCQSGWR